jgi:type I restriction enzyme R subunit
VADGVTVSISEYSGHQFADYALLGDDGYPIAVVEAKKTSKDARIGQEQAFQYAQSANPDNTRTNSVTFL